MIYMSEELTAIRQDVNAIRRLLTELVTIVSDMKSLSAKEQFQPASTINVTNEAKTEPKPEEPKPEKTKPKPTQPKKEKKEDKTNIVEVGQWCDVEGVLKDDPILSKGDRADGTEWRRANFRLDLPTQTVRVTLWDELASEIMQYVAGEHVALNGLMAKEPYKEGAYIELNSGKYTKITVLS